jgi:hypothetical protein
MMTDVVQQYDPKDIFKSSRSVLSKNYGIMGFNVGEMKYPKTALRML